MKKDYTLGEAMKRLEAFDELGMEPEEIKGLMSRLKRKPVFKGPYLYSKNYDNGKRIEMVVEYCCPTCIENGDGSRFPLLRREKIVTMDYRGDVMIQNDLNKSVDPDLRCHGCGQLIDWSDWNPTRDIREKKNDRT
jgi:hypothetical protein